MSDGAIFEASLADESKTFSWTWIGACPNHKGIIIHRYDLLPATDIIL